MEQPRLADPALDGLAVTASYDWCTGWRLSVRYRRSGASWSAGGADVYEALTADELCDVLDATLSRLLGLST